MFRFRTLNAPHGPAQCKDTLAATRRPVYLRHNRRVLTKNPLPLSTDTASATPHLGVPASARHHLLDCGERLVARKGFVGVGLAEILSTAGVPKGSFYHYFASKERFGEALLTRYTAAYLEQLDRLLRADGTPARTRLMRYWSHWNVSQCDSAAADCSSGEGTGKCLIVKLSAEVADISEAMRLALRDGTEQVVQRIADCIDEGRADGSLPNGKPALDVARVLYQMWLGAALLSKLSQDRLPLLQAREATEHLLLCGNTVALSTPTN